MTLRKLSKVVTLPKNVSTIEHQHLLATLGVTRQLLNTWRGRNGFPQSHKNGRSSFVLTDALIKWLEEQNVTIRRI